MVANRPPRAFLAFLALAVILTAAASVARSDPQWLNDVEISNSSPGMEGIFLDAKEDDSALYAFVTKFGQGNKIAWNRSVDGGNTWQPFWEGIWGVDGVTSVGAAYGFDRLLWSFQISTLALVAEAVDTNTGNFAMSVVSIQNESPRVIRKVVVDSNAETSGTGDKIFVVCAVMEDPSTHQVTLKAYRSTDLGVTWSAGIPLDQGPVGNPDYIGDIAVAASIAGFPYFHVAYVRAGRPWVVTTANAGVSWGAPVQVVVDLGPGTPVGVASHGVQVVVLGESEIGQIVYGYSGNHATTWGSAMQLDTPEGTGRLPTINFRWATFNAAYRKGDGRIAVRRSIDPVNLASWSPEEVASSYPTSLPFSVCGLLTDAGIAYVRSSDPNPEEPYYTSLGTLSGVGSPPFASSPSVDGLAVYPQPSRGSVVIQSRSTGSREPLAVGRIIDATGRTIARVRATEYAGDDQVYRWDGRDAAGREVPRGIYYFTTSSLAGTRSAPVAVIR